MTHVIPFRRDARAGLLPAALALAASGVPVLPLRAGKVPVGNCRTCADNACGGRPNMKTPGPCSCPRPCHGWAAATTNRAVLSFPAWTAAWRRAVALAYHPGGAGVTVVDLDDADALAWARKNLPATRTVPTTRGEHWIYRGVMPSRNAVRPGVDIKSTMAYARFLGPGTGTLTPLPAAVRVLVEKAPAVVRPAPRPVTASVPGGGGQCPHRSPVYLERGIAMAEQHITEARSQVHATVYQTFLAVLATHGRCGCLTDAHVTRLFAAAQAKGETLRHCADAWANARTALGV
ncbi:bifunctional DNA primase/polymerase [Streptomyces sudanensis]|uniref:bifunctional DNA primase/polymerase n=1 Tax=Streptomyces sudanensis TaxID=436397 RepID=UPI0020CB766F|nr:bifunctional DNA primase/polymerase [Streptomyces sudanensis]MCP9987268.1 bifunctional DNA primase/polymerase [Streptomyces sudanensis]